MQDIERHHRLRHVSPRFRIVMGILLVLFLSFYLVPLSFDNPRLHTFADTVRDGGVPLVIVHGLGSAPDSFYEFQERLEADGLYVNGKDNIDDKTVCDYAKTGKPMSFAVSFYPQASGRAVDRLSDSLGRTVSEPLHVRDTLDSYTTILAQRIQTVKRCTGANEVDVLAYSMGGMIARSTLTDVRHIIFLGTPQRYGLYGNKTLDVGLGASVDLGDIEKTLAECKRSSGKNIIYSTLLSRDLSLDCQVLEYALLFRASAAMANTTAAMDTIVGDLDGRGDGLIERSATTIPGVSQAIVHCEHNALRSPSRCPAAYDDAKELLVPGHERRRSAIDAFYDALLRLKLALRTGVTGS